jgi:putative hemolysin
MNLLLDLAIAGLLALHTLVSYVDRLYSEMGRFLSRDFQENIDVWEEQVEPRLGFSRSRAAQSAALLVPLSLAALVLLFGELALAAWHHGEPMREGLAELILAIVLATLIFRGFLPQMLFTRTRGQWIVRLTGLLRVLFWLVSPVTLALAFLLSIAALAETGAPPEVEHPSEAVEALIEAGKDEGILDESDRALVRSAVEFGDKIVREVMTPRPSVFAVAASMTLAEFAAQLRVHAYSRVPVYGASLDEVVGIAFLHDLLHLAPQDAGSTTVGAIARPAMFTPETKNLQSLLGEMQHAKQHMAIVIDEYGGVSGLITIEDIVEEIVGAISDEHETAGADEAVQREPDGAVVVAGRYELADLERLFVDIGPLNLPESSNATTVGGLLSEEAGHIPLPGESIQVSGLRFEVLAASARRVDRVRVRPVAP